MRPKFFALCAASLLLASVAHCALAQDGGGTAPLISSGHPSNAAATPGARRMLSDDEPTSTLRDQALRDQALREQAPPLGDESWTVTPQPAISATQSSRAIHHVSDNGSTGSDRTGQPTATAPASPLQAVPEHAAPLQRVPSQDRGSPSTVSNAGVPPASGATHLRSHVAQAQFTSATPVSPESRRETKSAQAGGDEHRPLKPPTASDPASDEKRSPGTVQMFVSVISSLLIVVGLLLGAAWCYRKATPSLSGSLPKQALQVLGRTPLAPRQQLILVRFGPKLVLMSNLQGEVRTISEIVDPLEVDRICGMCESSQAGSISDSFRTVLHNIGRTG